MEAEAPLGTSSPVLGAAAPTRSVAASARSGYLPKGRSLSPRTWHGLPRTHVEPPRARAGADSPRLGSGSPRSLSAATAGAKRLAQAVQAKGFGASAGAPASPRTPPRWTPSRPAPGYALTGRALEGDLAAADSEEQPAALHCEEERAVALKYGWVPGMTGSPWVPVDVE